MGLFRTALAATVVGFAAARHALAAECVFPDNVDWVVDVSCEISGLQIAPQNLLVVDDAVLTIEPTGRVIVDTRNFSIRVAPDARIQIEPGGRIRANQVGPRLIRLTDGGVVGYFLKEVGGPVLEALNSNVSFHPSSTIKTLYMLEALRFISLTSGDPPPNQVTLATNLTLCPTNVVAAGAGAGVAAAAGCPVAYATNDGTTGGSGAGGNCTAFGLTAGPGPAVPNTLLSCGGATVQRSLGASICAMMKVSNNPTANAIQEFLGNGNPQLGWVQMVGGAGTAVGLTSTTFANRMGCGGPRLNDPDNRTTLRDLGRLFEGMVSDPSVLEPAAPPPTVDFPTTNAYAFMLNEGTAGESLDNAIDVVVTEQAMELGLPAGTDTTFSNMYQFAFKDGNNLTKDMNGDGMRADLDTDGDGVNDVIEPRDYRTFAGWLSLPIDGGMDTQEYVFGIFVNDIDPMPGLPANFRLDVELAEMFRPIIRDALRDF